FDACLLAGGSREPRDLKIEGRELEGVHFAMDYLTQSNRRVSGEKFAKGAFIDAKGKKVVVIGGGDTGSDCVGTANRQGASCVIQIEVLAQPDLCRSRKYPWPNYPVLLKTTSSHEEGCRRHWEVTTSRFIGENGILKKLSCVKKDGAFEIEADMAIIAIGFLHPEHSPLIKDLNVDLDERGNVKTDSAFKASVDKVFSAGDMRRGQSLVVWAISEGRRAAASIDKYLTGAI
ncbi:MAG: FAD-dependent oxidoreductase, partial [Candidatus Omnitrophota bacterium]